MANPYTGIITPALKTAFNNAIDALLENTALTVPCQINYGGVKFTDCVNCQGGMLYASGGPIPFSPGSLCPYCAGVGHFQVEETEIVHLVCIFDSKKLKGIVPPISPSTFNMYAQTMCALTLTPKLKAAKTIILDSNNKLYSRNVYKRYGEPEPLGFGDMRYILATWERVN